MYLEQINQVNDIKKLDKSEWEPLAQEIRDFLIEKISVTGGHLASNLGVVELTMAMHLAFDFPQDKVVWDVGHQSYTHKLLTGRRAGFDDLRKYGGMSGFPKRKESDCDCFDTGHSSTSISAGIGLVEARELLGGNYSVISVIGDGALTGGMAFEALNNASRLKSNFIIVLNDNQMSIAENVGGLSQYLNGLRSAEGYNNFKEGLQNTLEKIPVYGEGIVRQLKKTKSGLKQLVIPGMFFENMGITYLGPVDGHNIEQLIRAFNDARRVRRTPSTPLGRRSSRSGRIRRSLSRSTWDHFRAAISSTPRPSCHVSHSVAPAGVACSACSSFHRANSSIWGGPARRARVETFFSGRYAAKWAFMAAASSPVMRETYCQSCSAS